MPNRAHISEIQQMVTFKSKRDVLMGSYMSEERMKFFEKILKGGHLKIFSEKGNIKAPALTQEKFLQDSIVPAYELLL